MQSYYLLFIFLSLTLCDDQYVHTFAQEWPGGVCRAEACQQAFMKNFDGKRFNMHGLWPNLNMQTFCQTMNTCTKELFDTNQLSESTVKKIDVGWVGLYSSTDVFRQHEWEKHGTCLTGSTQDTFFATVMAISEKYNIYDALAAAGIHPNDNTQISQTQIITAVQQYLQTPTADVHMSCYKEVSTGKLHLAQVKFCLGDNFQPRNCKCTLQQSDEDQRHSVGAALVSCPTLLYFPTYQAPISYELLELK